MENNLQQPLSRLRFWLGVCVGITLGLVMLAGIAFTVIRARQPDLPVEWRQLGPGMSRAQIEAMIPDTLSYLREEKGFDSAHRQITPNYVWLLSLHYDAQGQTTTAETRLVHRRYGFLGRSRGTLF